MWGGRFFKTKAINSGPFPLLQSVKLSTSRLGPIFNLWRWLLPVSSPILPVVTCFNSRLPRTTGNSQAFPSPLRSTRGQDPYLNSSPSARPLCPYLLGSTAGADLRTGKGIVSAIPSDLVQVILPLKTSEFLIHKVEISIQSSQDCWWQQINHMLN